MKKVALITGGTRGIGLGIARRLSAEGCALAVNGVRPGEAVTEVVTELRQTGQDVIYCQADIGKSEDRARMLAQVQEHYGRLDILVNNAGVAPKERLDLLESTEESFDFVVGTNLKGTYFLTQAAAHLMIEQRKAEPSCACCIVNITSVSADMASVNRGEYCVAKAGLGMATKLFAARLGEFNIPVYEVRPGITQTDMTAGVQEKYDRLIGEGICIQRRWGFPEDVGRAVASLVRGDFAYSSGQVFTVDGGLTVPRL
jgi:NAD(P)-dependent dehydrogenase (short-subunit alcohol dehydrogenase family)